MISDTLDQAPEIVREIPLVAEIYWLNTLKSAAGGGNGEKKGGVLYIFVTTSLERPGKRSSRRASQPALLMQARDMIQMFSQHRYHFVVCFFLFRRPGWGRFSSANANLNAIARRAR